MDKKKNLLCCGALCLVVLAAGAAILLQRGCGGERVASVYSHGELIETIDLAAVEEPYTFTVGEPNGDHNLVSVRRGEIAVESATCPDGICVKTGYISSPGLPIVCLPNELVITVGEDGGEIDAVTR